MKALLNMFGSQLRKALNPTFPLDCKVQPTLLLNDLNQPSQLKKLTDAIQCPSANPFKYIRLLSLCNLLLIYGQNYLLLIEQKLKLKATSDAWLHSHFIMPYHQFLIKCCTSSERYKDANSCYLRKDGALQTLFYVINMLKLIFKVVQKMPLLGRYYQPSHPETINSAIQVIALQAQRFYAFFKATLGQILRNREYYIKNKSVEKIIAGILVDQLIFINQEVEKLFLDRYFYPMGRGIVVKIFQLQEQNPEVQRVVHSILEQSKDTLQIKSKKHKMCFKQGLFEGNDSINYQFNYSLALTETRTAEESRQNYSREGISTQLGQSIQTNRTDLFGKGEQQGNARNQKQEDFGCSQVDKKQN